ncbi:MAG: nucleoside-diphosphate kinase [Candidatus Thermoplasmatota archaeon]
MSRTLVLIKPDGVQRGLIGEVVRRFERRGLKIAGMKMLWIPVELAERHYAEHKGKKFYEPLVSYITSCPVVAMVLEGENAVQVVRGMIGRTNPQEALAGTVRGDLALQTARNIVHGSDSDESAAREISLFFSPEELYDYEKIDEGWLYE